MTLPGLGNRSEPTRRKATEPDGLIDSIARAATSWLGLLAAYAVAFTSAVIAFQKLPDSFKGLPLWLRIGLMAALPAVALAFQVVEHRRRKGLLEVSGVLRPGYFRLVPQEDQSSFRRADGQHEEILGWLRQCKSRVCYLTGLSGSGKSSLLLAWVLPKLEASGTMVIRLRGHQDPLAALEQELKQLEFARDESGVGKSTLVALIEGACLHSQPKPIVVVLDQFEEFIVLQDPVEHGLFREFLSCLQEKALTKVTFLLVFRSDYIGMLERLGLPALEQSRNWKEVPPFFEGAALEFLRDAGLQVSDALLRGVLREAVEIERTKGLIRPVTINLCGLVIGRFATRIPRGFRPGELIRGFLRESISLPSVQHIAPALIPHLISNYATKRPRTITWLVHETGHDASEVRGCLRTLGKSDRGIVRSLDADQQTWEISHDFIVPLLDSIVCHWTVSLRRRVRPWLPWISAATLVLTMAISLAWNKDPIVELTELGWQIFRTSEGLQLRVTGAVPRGTHRALERLKVPPHVTIYLLRTGDNALERSVPELKNARALNLTLNNFSGSYVGDSLDLRSLTELGNLVALELAHLPVKDVSPLKDLTNLTKLNLNATQVRDITPLRKLKKLTVLRLQGTGVKDISPLEELHNLAILDLSGNPEVHDISSLKELVKLAELKIGNTCVSDLSPLQALNNLTMLDIEHAYANDLSPLRDLKNLKTTGGARLDEPCSFGRVLP